MFKNKNGNKDRKIMLAQTWIRAWKYKMKSTGIPDLDISVKANFGEWLGKEWPPLTITEVLRPDQWTHNF